MSRGFTRFAFAALVILAFAAGLAAGGCRESASAGGGQVPDSGLVCVGSQEVLAFPGSGDSGRLFIYRDDARQAWVYVLVGYNKGGVAVLPYSLSVDPRGGE